MTNDRITKTQAPQDSSDTAAASESAKTPPVAVPAPAAVVGPSEQPRTHDPRRLIEGLRDHLAAHNQRLAFLFGAGTSSAINIAPPPRPGEEPSHEPLIPGVLALTTICQNAVSALGKAYENAWSTLVDQCALHSPLVNIEHVLSRVRSKLDAIGDGERLLGLDLNALRQFETLICSTIATKVLPDESVIPESIPHDVFVRWVQRAHRTAPLEVFTTNYDILFERACELAAAPVFDGFVGAHEPFFYADCLDDDDLLPQPAWIRLWKLHGSVNWKQKELCGRKRIIRTQPDTSGELILPSHRKYDESRKQPYTSFMDRLGRILKREHALVITCGYGFGDEHINAVLYGALDSNPTANVVALWFEDLTDDIDLVKQSQRRSNLSVVGPNAGVISGAMREWRLIQPVDKKTHAFMDTAFDSNAYPVDEGSPAAATGDLTGRMRLGDFNWFCRFLSEMDVRTP